jgi:hypothetical protein
LAKIDPSSTAFRYGETYNKSTKQRVKVDGEIYVSLRHLQRTMKALNEAILTVWHSGKIEHARTMLCML